jgi:formylmethanofuran dehydrogenase subunit B
MTYHFSSNTVKLNKGHAISKHQSAIEYARKLLKVEGKEPVYYDWHKRTIELNRKAIEEILAQPDTMWN